MTSNRFFIEPEQIQFPYIFLEGDEHHHLSNVARIKPPQKVWLFNGKGTGYLAQVEEIMNGRTRLRILEKEEENPPRVKITLSQALIKTKNMEFILQKATELGLSHFIPVVSSRSLVKVEGKINTKINRWKRIIREAAKQSGASSLPSVSPPQELSRVIQRKEEKKLLLSERGGKKLKEILLDDPQVSGGGLFSTALILVGPEGGWTEQEEIDILGHGFERVSLGSQILRTETASICAAAMMAHFWNQ